MAPSSLRLVHAHLNLCRNPFGELPDDQKAALAVVDLERFVGRLARPGFAVEFVGSRGRGKTTRLHVLRQHFPDAPLVGFARPPRLFWPPRPPERGPPVIFVDDGQFLSPRQRRRLLGRPASFVIATHESFAASFVARGLEYESLEVGGLSVELLGEIVDRRIEWARRAPGPVPTVAPAALAALLDWHGDNVRAIEHHLYEVFQALEELTCVTVRHLD